MNTHVKSPYNESLFFAIEQICKYIQEDYISKYNQEITHDEFRILDIINYNPDICQRDLAKLALRDCVKVGRILNNLEQKCFISRFNDLKGKRLVKKMELTTQGKKFYSKMLNSIEPETSHLLENTFTKKQIDDLKKSLEKLQKALSEKIVVQI